MQAEAGQGNVDDQLTAGPRRACHKRNQGRPRRRRDSVGHTRPRARLTVVVDASLAIRTMG